MHTYESWAGQPFTKTALVKTNDSQMPQFTLTLTGQVEPSPVPLAPPQPQ